MFYLLIGLLQAEVCKIRVDFSNIKREFPYTFYLGYTSPFEDKIDNISIHKEKYNYYEYYIPIPHYIKFYYKYLYCSDWILFYEKNISDIDNCQTIGLQTESISDKCLIGHSISINQDKDMGDYYQVVVVDRKNESHELPYYGDYFEPFSVDIYLKSRYFDGLEYLETLKIDNGTMFKTYYYSDIPTNLLPEKVCFSSKAPYYYKLRFRLNISETNETHELYRNLNFTEEFRYPFEAIIYLFSSESCNYTNGREILKIQSAKNYTCQVITIDDIPDECTIDNYPDDSPKYQPDTVNKTNIPYSFIFVSNENVYNNNSFNDLVQKCKNGIVNYKHCSFLNNAVEAYYSNSQSFFLERLGPYCDKLFILTSLTDLFPDFSSLKHQMIVHVKAIDDDDLELYFQNYDKPTIKRHDIFIDDVKNKVSYLTVENLRVASNILNVDTVYFKNSTQASYRETYSDNIIIENSIVYRSSNYHYKQITVVMKNITRRPQYQIQFLKNKYLAVCYKDYDDENYNCDYSYYFGNADSFGLVAVSHYFDLYVDYSSQNIVYDFQNVNISLLSIDDELTSFENEPTLLEEEQKYYVNLTSSGKWGYILNVKNLYFTAHHNLINLEKSLNSRVIFSEAPIYKYKPVTWAPRFYKPLNYTDKSLISYIIITDPSDEYRCNSNLNYLLSCRWTECSKEFGSIDYYIDAKCATKDTINETLKNIPPNTDKVYIDNDVDDIYLDFNNLPHQVPVKIASYQSLFHTKLLENETKHASASNPSNLIWGTVILNGAIKQKVSYLTVYNSYIRILGSPLNVHTVKLLNCNFEGYEATQSINSDDLIVNFDTHVFLFDHQAYIKVKQYGLIVPYDKDDELKYKITFGSDRWSLYYMSADDEEYEPINEYYGYVPYKYADKVCLIILSHNFEFNVEDDTVRQLKNVNITLLNEDPTNDVIEYHPIENYKYPVCFTSSGPWNQLKLNITFTAFQNLVNLTDATVLSNIIVNKEEFINFTTHELVIPTQSPNPYPSETPVPTVVPTKTPIPEFVDTLYKDENKGDITDVEQFNTNLNKAFEELDKNEGDGHRVVVVNAKSFPFQQELTENHYIKPIANSKINFIQGNLNLVLPNDGDVSISLNNTKDVKLTLKGNGNLTFESQEKEINIKNNANLNGSLQITIPDSVDTISIDSIDLSDEGSIECKSTNGNNVQLIVNKINANAQSNMKLNSVVIKDTLIASQDAKLVLNKVDFKDSKIIYNLNNLYVSDYLLNGIFDDPPKSIEIHSNEKPEMYSYYNIAKGTFKDYPSCNEWSDIIQFDDNDVIGSCQYIYRSLEEEYQIRLQITYHEDPPKGKSFPVGGIIGIVVGVIVVIAIVVVVVIVIKKKKNNNANSSGSENEGDENKQDEV